MSFWQSLWIGVAGKIRRFMKKKKEKERTIRDWVDMDADLEEEGEWLISSVGGLSSTPERKRE